MEGYDINGPKEVADRILADTGTKNYGRLSLMVSLKTMLPKL